MEKSEIMKENAINICKILQENGHQAHFVGGCVRDQIMGIIPKDFDIATSAKPDEIHEIFKDYKTLDIGEAFGIVSVIINNVAFEVATFRSDNDCDGRKPGSVDFNASIFEDCSRRDFTCNAMGFDPISGMFIDFFKGKEDIKNKIIRFVNDPKDRIKEDKLRILRLFRFATKYNFSIPPEYFLIIRQMEQYFTKISQERITQEFTKVLLSDNAFEGILVLAQFNTLFQIVPELENLISPHNSKFHKEEFEGYGNTIFAHVLLVFKNAVVRSIGMNDDDKLILRLSALFHDIGKPLCRAESKTTPGTDSFVGHDMKGAIQTQGILKRMKFPSRIIDKVCSLIRNHMNVHNLSHKMKRIHKIRRFLGKKNIDLIVTLGICDTLGTKNEIDCPEPAATDLEIAVKKYRSMFPVMLPEPILNGLDLISEKLEPGEHFKKALEAAYDQQLCGCDDKAKLLNFAKGTFN